MYRMYLCILYTTLLYVRAVQLLCTCVLHVQCTHVVVPPQGKRGRLGARSKYVDVLNPGGTSKSDPVPPPAALGAPLISGGQFSGTFFVPQQLPQGTLHVYMYM